MSAVAAAIVGSAVVGAGAGIYASKKASSAQRKASQTASNTELAMYYQSRKDIAPWRDVGQQALKRAKNVIFQGPGPYEESPQYNFLVGETNKALARSQSARGRLDSGAALREAARYGEGLASTEYQNYLTNWIRTKVNPLLALSGQGQVSAGQSASGALQTGGQIAQNVIGAGNATASGYISQANAITGGLNAGVQGYNNYLFNQYLQNQYNPNPMNTAQPYMGG